MCHKTNIGRQTLAKQGLLALVLVLPIQLFAGSVIDLKVSPGQVAALKYTASDLATRIKDRILFCNGKKRPYALRDNTLTAYIAVSYFDSPRNFDCELRKDSLPADVVAHVSVAPKKYPSEAIEVEMKRVALSKKDQARVDKERKILDAIYGQSSNAPRFGEPFVAPLDSKLTSIYGTKRVFNHHAQTQHLGTDFRAETGTNVISSNDGEVVFAGDLFYSGNTVLVDHGLEIFVMYGHLSKLSCKAGDLVKKGDLLGLSGATGRVSGPHLHWGVKISGEWVDGFSLVDASKMAL
jgi:murein DD-endopeptidase MepM/ murein hydrolase activator NlpD